MSPGGKSFLQSAHGTHRFNYVALLPSHYNPRLHIGWGEAEHFGGMVWHEVVDSSGWIIGAGHISVKNGEKVLDLDVVTALIDSGTPFMYGPAEDVQNIYSTLGVPPPPKENPNTYHISCNMELKVGFRFGTGETRELDLASTGYVVHIHLGAHNLNSGDTVPPCMNGVLV
jgi:hypothetical protein